MEIGLDFDGVIVDCGELKAMEAKLLFNVSFPADRFCKKYVVEEEGLLTLGGSLPKNKKRFLKPKRFFIFLKQKSRVIAA